MPVSGVELPLLLVVAGVSLLILETMAPTEYFLVVGIALLLAGTVGTFVAAAASPIALAGLTLIFGAATFYVYREFEFYGSGSAGQTSDSSSLRGETATVVDRVTDSEGRIKLDSGGFSPYYAARALDGPIEVDEEVVVVDPGGGNVLTVLSRSGFEEDEIDRALQRDAQQRVQDDGADDGDGAARADDVADESSDLETERSE